MEAIMRADGRQLRVVEGQEIELNRVEGDPGDTISFEVLMLLDGRTVTVGKPIIAGAAVTATITQHGKAPKLRFMKYKNKVRYRRTYGHRQPVTRLIINKIAAG